MLGQSSPLEAGGRVAPATLQRLRNSPRGRVAPSPALLCLLTIVLAGGCAPANDRPPKAVFLIVVDTLRPDRLSCYSDTDNHTPNLERLARSGVLFREAWSAASWTVPSMGAIMTSRYPTQLGLIERKAERARFRQRERRKQIRYTLDPTATTLAEMMRGAGFRTAAFVNQPFINSHDGFMQGFDEWCHPVSNLAVRWHNPALPAPDDALPAGTELGQADRPLVDEFIDWIDEAGREPVFVWLHLLRPHWPYLPPPRYMASYPDDWARTESPSVRYDGEVRASDDDVGRVLDAIDRRIGLENCVVVFTSDHGEAFGEHNGSEHGHTLHAEVTHVPLIVRAPRLPSGRVVDERVRTLDILPTILYLAGVPADSTAGIEGKSLVPLQDVSDRAVYSEGMLYEATERSLIDDDYRLMYDSEGGERYLLFDLTSDRGENTDVGPKHGERVTAMRRRMNALRRRFLTDFRDRVASKRHAKAKNPEGGETDRVIRSLKSLGYIK